MEEEHREIECCWLLRMEERGPVKGRGWRSWKRHGNGFCYGALREGCSPASTLVLAQRLALDF